MVAPTPAAGSPSTELTGRTLGPYHLIRRLGRGGMADVYLARQETLDRLVALKVLRADLARDETYVKRFLREARAAAALSDAHVVQIIDVADSDGWHYIAQEYVPGLNLRQYLQRHGPLSLRLAVRVLDQVAQALEKASRLNLVHRDIKPENLMLTREAEVKVADFGLARAVTGGTQLALTQEGMTLGTPLYMSPEQIEGRPADARSDLYSLGVTMFHLLTGSPPYDGESAIAVAMQHLHKTVPSVATHRPDLPQALTATIARLMAKAPEDRVATPTALRRLLREVPLAEAEVDGPLWDEEAPPTEAETLGPLAETRALKQSLTSRAARRSPWRRWVVVGLVAAGCALATGAYVGGRTAPRPLAERIAEALPHVPPFGTAEEQYVYAMHQPDDTEAFRAVRDFHDRGAADPRSELYFRLADQQLATIFLERDDLAAAEPYLRQLYGVGEAEPNFYALGAAGLARIAQARGLIEEAALYLAEAYRFRDFLPDSIRTRVEAALSGGRAG